MSTRRGRPRKFSRPSTATTLTLPDDVIEALRTVDSDLSLAIVRLAQPLLKKQRSPAPPLELVGDKPALIMMKRSRVLEQHTGAELLPLSDGRALVSLSEGSIDDVELRLRDTLRTETLAPDDSAMFSSFANLLRRARLGVGLTLQQRRILLVQAKT